MARAAGRSQTEIVAKYTHICDVRDIYNQLVYAHKWLTSNEYLLYLYLDAYYLHITMGMLFALAKIWIAKDKQ